MAESMYEVTTDITEVYCAGSGSYQVRINDGTWQTFQRGSTRTWTGAGNRVPVNKTAGAPYNKVESRLDSDGTISTVETCAVKTEVNNQEVYQFYQKDSNGNPVLFGGTVPTESDNPEDTTLKAVFNDGGGQVIIVLGDYVLDPPIVDPNS